MSGFEDYHNKAQSPAKVYHKWSGGAKENITLPDGGTAVKLRGELNHWDAQANEKVVSQLPFRFAVLEQTKRITGFAPSSNGPSTRYYSNEAVEFNDILKVYRKVGENPAEVVAEGEYSKIKPNLPQGARLASVLYGYNPDTEQIEVITLQGASLSSFIEFSKANKIYTGYITIEEGEKKTNGSVEYVPPVFKMAENYTDADMDLLRGKSSDVKAYLNEVKSKNMHSNTVGDLAEALNVEVPEGVQEPAQPAEDNNNILFNDIPF